MEHTGERTLARILIVDDNRAIAEALTIVVSSRGHEAMVAYSGEAALELCQEQQPDVMLLDLNMPGIDGFETLGRLRGLPHGKDLPVLIITARDDDDLESRIEALGGNGLLKKPVDVNNLAHQIEMHTAGAPTQA